MGTFLKVILSEGTREVLEGREAVDDLEGKETAAVTAVAMFDIIICFFDTRSEVNKEKQRNMGVNGVRRIIWIEWMRL